MLIGYETFKEKIFKLTNIDLSCYKERQMKRRIDSLITRNNFQDYDSYYNALLKDSRLYNEFINYLTINVSEFYRNPSQWEILEKEIIPKLLSKKNNLKIWSAACSTGEEPYSLVMLLSKFMNLKDIKIYATDIDDDALRKAKIGTYNEKSLANLPSDFIHKFFNKNSNMYNIKEEVKKCVEYKKHNLLMDKYPTDCDIITCRNVLIYFTEEAKNNIYMKFSKSLSPEGVLFVGSTEQIISSQKYNLEPMKNFFYRLKK
ncbi:CheR family methyltransferase [Lutispora thermophila]|uniref:protein-glutamate O-methyltransferase n=1 Tax=Lutispora thermophila DSM 19022 TaxID=1122184 RepID=A0A1M6F8L9_9FIRM|nr:protein-glutamate O-methyltransferase CheR [Lutispora thermophila]SHI93939.1 chemotaxis protein methyltransferase CheR [Lutispora thermophila DSM 19022]